MTLSEKSSLIVTVDFTQDFRAMYYVGKFTLSWQPCFITHQISARSNPLSVLLNVLNFLKPLWTSLFQADKSPH